MTSSNHLLRLLERPVITEKTTKLAELGQYVFEVNKTANKVELAKAFEIAFPGRQVQTVRVIQIPPYKKRSGRRMVETGAKRKAVFSITGEPLEFFGGA